MAKTKRAAKDRVYEVDVYLSRVIRYVTAPDPAAAIDEARRVIAARPQAFAFGLEAYEVGPDGEAVPEVGHNA
jgi:hypothetical protein